MIHIDPNKEVHNNDPYAFSAVNEGAMYFMII